MNFIRSFLLSCLCCSLAVAEDGVFLTVGGDSNHSKIRNISSLEKSERLLVTTNDKCIRLRKTDDFSLVDEYRFEIGNGRIGEITSAVTVSPDENQFAFGRYGNSEIGSGEIFVVQMNPKKILYRLKTNKHRLSITAVSFFDEGKKLASLDQAGGVVIWDLQTGKVENNVTIKSSVVKSLSLNSSGKLALGTSGGEVFIMQASPLKFVARQSLGKLPLSVCFWISDQELISFDSKGTFKKLTFKNKRVDVFKERKLGPQSRLYNLAIDSRKKRLHAFFGLSGLVAETGKDYSQRVFDYDLNQLSQPKEFKDRQVDAVAIADGRRELILAFSTGSFEKWSMDPLKKQLRIENEANNKYFVAFDPKNSIEDKLEVLWSIGVGVKKLSSKTAALDVERNRGFSLFDFTRKGGSDVLVPSQDHRRIPYEEKGIRSKLKQDVSFQFAANGNEMVYVEFKNKTPINSDRWKLRPSQGSEIFQYALLSEKVGIVATEFGTYSLDPINGKVIREMSEQMPGVRNLTFSKNRDFMATYSGYDRSIAIWGLKKNRESPKFLASLRVAGDDWALVSDAGYFNCTPAAEKFFGWHVNAGPKEFASFHELDKFSDKFRNPSYLQLLFALQDGRQVEQQLNLLGQRATIKGSLGPEIEILAPVKAEIRQNTSRDLEVVVGFKERNGEVPRAVQLQIQGRPDPNHFHTLTAQDRAAQKYPFSVKLAEGDQTIRAVVYPQNSPDSFASEREIKAGFHSVFGQKTPGRKLFYMGVGIKNYEDHDGRGYDDLDFCQSDVKAIGEVFKEVSPGAFIEPPEIKILNDPTSKDEFADQLEEMLKDEKGQPEFEATDTLVVMWSGHGDMTNGDRQEFHLVLPSCEKPTDNSDRSLRRNGMSTQDMLADLKDLAGKGNVILILDTCYSGLFVREFKDSRKKLTSEANDDEYGIMVISAAGSDETSKESSELKMSNFAFLLRHGLLGSEQFEFKGRAETFSDPTAVRQLDAGRIVTTDSLVKFLKKNMPKLVDDQTVRVNGGGNMNIFLAMLGEEN